MDSNTSSDLRKLLRHHVRGDGRAFQAIAKRLSGLVYHTAFRRSGSHSCAEEVVQLVLVRMSKKAAKLVKHPELLAWVHEASRLETLKYQRGELRRKKREEKAMKPSEDDQITDPHLLAELDESMKVLRDSERELVLMRFFEGRTFPAIAAETGRSESAEKMRLKRALEKMAGWFGKKGMTLSVAGLTTVLGAEMGKAAPVGLSAGSVALGGVGSSAGAEKVAVGVSILVATGFVVPILSALDEVKELEAQKTAIEEARRTSYSDRSLGAKTSSREGRASSAQVPFIERELSISDLAWRYDKAEDQYDKVTLSRVELVLEEMDLQQLEEFGRRLIRNYPSGFRREVARRLEGPERVEFLMKSKFPRRSLAGEFEGLEIAEAGEWLIAKERRGELISKSQRCAYRKQLWYSFHRMLKSATLREGVIPDPRFVEFVRIGSQIAPLINRPGFEKLEAELDQQVSRQEGGGQ